MKPTTYDITYYRGDDFSVYIFPKDSTGANLPMSGTTPYFRLASSRGDNPTWKSSGTATIDRSVSGGPLGIFCTLSNTIGRNVRNGYVYDIGYVSASGKRTTVLTGRMIVVDWVES